MATSLDVTEVTVIRSAAVVSPTDYSHGPADNNDHVDFPGRG